MAVSCTRVSKGFRNIWIQMSQHVDRPVSINSDFKTKAPAQLRLHTFYEVLNPCRGINVRHPLQNYSIQYLMMPSAFYQLPCKGCMFFFYCIRCLLNYWLPSPSTIPMLYTPGKNDLQFEEALRRLVRSIWLHAELCLQSICCCVLSVTVNLLTC